MSSSQNYGDTSVLSKEHPDSTFCDEGCSGASPTSQDRMILKKGPWTASEDALLIQYVKEYGEGNWNAVQKESGLLRCGKSCRLRWANHLRPHLKKGTFSPEEEQVIIMMHSKVGNKWAQMAACLPGRTDNEIKNYWNTRIKRRQRAGLPIYPNFDSPTSNENQLVPNSSELSGSDQQNNCGLLHGDIVTIPDFQLDSHHAKSGSAAYVPTLFPDNLDPYTCSYLNPGENRFVQTTVSLPNTTNLKNENFSSSMPESGTAKMELPSLQFPETDYVDWITSSSFRPSFELDPYFQSPNCVSEQPQCDSSRNNGLLSDLVHESRAISSGKKRSFDKISANISVLHTNTDPTSPFCLSAVSLFNWRNPIVDGHLDEFPAFGLHLDSEEALPGSEWIPAFSRPVKPAQNDPDALRPDALLGSDLFFGNIGHDTGDRPMTNLHEEQTPSSSGAALFSFMNSHPWARMPHAFQISEL